MGTVGKEMCDVVGSAVRPKNGTGTVYYLCWSILHARWVQVYSNIRTTHRIYFGCRNLSIERHSFKKKQDIQGYIFITSLWMLRMYSMIMEEKYECNAATIYGKANADTIVKKKKRFWTLNCRRPGRWNQLIGHDFASPYVKHCLCIRFVKCRVQYVSS